MEKIFEFMFKPNSFESKKSIFLFCLFHVFLIISLVGQFTLNLDAVIFGVTGGSLLLVFANKYFNILYKIIWTIILVLGVSQIVLISKILLLQSLI